jgi:hypothetical protein
MNTKRLFLSCVTAALLVNGGSTSASPFYQAETDDGVEVLTRGPVHEAFAQTVAFDPEPGIIVSATPPEAIEELPPDQRPDGDNVQWIPGYFAWDDDREDFLWVSGIWRNLPPERQWVPGYWVEVSGGAQWISGYWADASLTEVQYLPEPPVTVEVGPNIDAPSADHIWLPGSWIWNETRYVWRPGYWAPVQADWDWIPAHYVWSPRGYVFNDGYYDYAVARRGVLFAPVYMNSTIYGRRGYTYSPGFAINLGAFTAHLFTRPSYGHYYFGDYYATNYSSAGYYPWFSYAADGYSYDPFYARQRWQYRDDNDWQQRIVTDFEHRRDNEAARPPRTLATSVSENRTARNADEPTAAMVMPLEEFTKNPDVAQNFRAINDEERQQVRERAQEFRKFRKDRQELEASATSAVAGKANPGQAIEPTTGKLARSPIAANPDATPGVAGKVPKRPEVPDLDPNVKPEDRPARVTGRDGKMKQGAASDAKSKGAARKEGAKKAAPGTAKSKAGQKEAAADDTPDAPTKGNRPKQTPKKGQPKTEPKSDRPKTQPKTDPGSEPQPNAPKVDPRPDRPKADADPDPDVPKTEPRPKTPRVDPTPDRPKADPTPDVPKTEPRPKTPRVDPTPDRPKADPTPDVPKTEPRPKTPRVDPTPDRPKTQPKADVPKSEPRPNIPKAEPRPNAPKNQPTPGAPKVDPTPGTPKTGT